MFREYSRVWISLLIYLLKFQLPLFVVLFACIPPRSLRFSFKLQRVYSMHTRTVRFYHKGNTKAMHAKTKAFGNPNIVPLLLLLFVNNNSNIVPLLLFVSL